MRIIIIIAFFIFLCSKAFSQDNIERVLSEIEKNNTGLKALENQQQARQHLNRTGIFLPDPEFGYAWFAGSPEELGNKTNISLIQSFRFPTAYFHKSRIANALNEQLIPEYQLQRSSLLLKARELCLELIYNNMLSMEYGRRLDHARGLVRAYSSMLDAGQTTIIEYNKSRLNLLNLQKEAEIIEIQRLTLQDQLTALNGGIEVNLPDEEFPVAIINDDFEQWYMNAEEQNPVLQSLRQEIEISRRGEKLQRALNLPAFNAGYVSEALTHEQFRGFTVGITIPLWESRNTMQYTRARTLASESAEHDTRLHYYNNLKSQHAKASSLIEATVEYRDILHSVDNSQLLEEALETGEISLTEYLMELSFVYRSVDTLLKMELELHQAISVLNQHFY